VPKTPPARPAKAEGEAPDESAGAEEEATSAAPSPEPPHPADLPGDSRLVIADFGLHRLFEGMRSPPPRPA
jgi:hypothetical protein